MIQVPRQPSAGIDSNLKDDHDPASEDNLISGESNVENEIPPHIPILDPSDYFDDPGDEIDDIQDCPSPVLGKLEPIFAEKDYEQAQPVSYPSPRSGLESIHRRLRNQNVENYLLAFLVLLLLAFNAFYSYKNSQSSNPRWEYRIETPNDIGFTTRMNTWGAEGWELVTARRASSLGDFSYEVILKRKK